MRNGQSAGASRRSRRLAYPSVGLFAIAGALLVVLGRGGAEADHGSWSIDDQEFARTDVQLATLLLESARGANPTMCVAADRAFDGGYWGGGRLLVRPTADVSEDVAEVARWIGKRKLDRDALRPARAGLASPDACVRRLAARIAGNVNVKRLDEELAGELDAADVATRVSTIIALGYAEQAAALPRLRRFLSDPDRSVRLAAIWAIGSLESHLALPDLLPLLRDQDAEIRRYAVWALGRIEDPASSVDIAALLQHDANAEVRRAAAWALGQMDE